jgi:uncharacterized protein YjhX (UPF0386 family)
MTRRFDQYSLAWLTFIFILLSTLGAELRAQEITYNLTPTHELGEQLWQIPISGKLTMSADGKRVLVACLADSAFYMVDVETGAYRKLKARYYQDDTYGNTYYRTDADLRYLAQANTNSISLNMWDLDADSVMVWKNFSNTNLSAVSKRLDRVIHGNLVMKASTLEIVDTLPEPVSAWYDDDRGKAYYLVGSITQLQEVDVSTNVVLRTWKVRPTGGAMLRPANSDWLYVFSTMTNGLKGGSQNLVEAINLVTGERLTFEKYFWSGADGYPEFILNAGDYFLPTQITCFARGSDAGHRNVLWEFSADTRRSDVVVDYSMMFYDRLGRQSFITTIGKDFIIRCWDSRDEDSSILRCNALVSIATSAQENPEDVFSTDVSVVQRDNTLSIELVGTTTKEQITNVQIFASDGVMVASVPVRDPSVPMTVPIGHLSSGAYRCVVTTTGRELFASFTIVR